MPLPMIGRLRYLKRGEVCQVRRRSTVVIAGIRRHQDAQLGDVTLVAFPVSGQDLALMPEGDRITEALWFFHNGEAPEQLQLNDVVLRRGKAYQIQMSEDWGPYVRAMGKLVDSGPERIG